MVSSLFTVNFRPHHEHGHGPSQGRRRRRIHWIQWGGGIWRWRQCSCDYKSPLKRLIGIAPSKSKNNYSNV